MPKLSLTLRTFLFSFLPVCVVLPCCFWVVNAAVHDRVRRELRSQLEASDSMLDRVNSDWSARTAALISKISESAGLKAAVGLLAEGHSDPALAAQVRRTIEAELFELEQSSGFDLVAVADLTGQTVAFVNCAACTGKSAPQSMPLERGLAKIDDSLYQLSPLPIDISGETTAILVLGVRFDLKQLAIPGDAVLTHGGKVVASTLTRSWNQGLEQQLATKCRARAGACEVSLNDETYVVSRLQKTQTGAGYELLGLQSLDAPVRDFTRAFLKTLVTIAVAGLVLALLCTIVTSRSISHPLRALVRQLNHAEASGDLTQRLTAGTAVHEFALLAEAYNRVADAAERSHRQLEIAKDAAQSANRLKDEFLTNVSHELRTPLNGVLGMADLLLHTQLDADQQDFTATIWNSGEALATIIDNILTFSQLQTGQLSLAMRPFDFAALLEEVEQWTARQAAAKEVAVQLSYPASCPRLFVGDEMYIRQILRHLCGNAVKFTDCGHVRLDFECSHASGDKVVAKVSVSDTGAGISSERQGLVFDHFTQLDGSLTRAHGGTGLGLALAKSLVTAMRGELGLESELGRGSCFWFTIPLRESHQLVSPVQGHGGARC